MSKVALGKKKKGYNDVFSLLFSQINTDFLKELNIFGSFFAHVLYSFENAQNCLVNLRTRPTLDQILQCPPSSRVRGIPRNVSLFPHKNGQFLSISFLELIYVLWNLGDTEWITIMYLKGNKGGIDLSWVGRQFCCIRLFSWSTKVYPLTLNKSIQLIGKDENKDEDTGCTWTSTV